jgi:small-conductance mechanosensitive channel
MVRDTITNGFEIGSVEIVPIKFIIALLSFAVMLSLIGWIKRRMGKSWLGRSHMERGSKEAMISLTGYFGAAIAFLLALTIAGVELANLALIAGALSVGIGFGLQNIVNNFVSGLILLFERPIKTGDWIVVGGTEGYVKNISIRSTQIQTFDRSDVIVPNSELISGQVTNWMFRDLIGRVVVPVGVAYGSDTKKVEQILLDIAYRQDEVIIKSPVLNKPWVLFREFGDSSLNFELRCFIRNVDQRLNVISAINFEIDQAFREAGIEIPFPQRDVHLIAKSNDDIANNDEIKSS